MYHSYFKVKEVQRDELIAKVDVVLYFMYTHIYMMCAYLLRKISNGFMPLIYYNKVE
jgi:hypothetical protein